MWNDISQWAISTCLSNLPSKLNEKSLELYISSYKKQHEFYVRIDLCDVLFLKRYNIEKIAIKLLFELHI